MDNFNNYRINQKALEQYTNFKNKNKKNKSLLNIIFILFSIATITILTIIFRESMWTWIIIIPIISCIFYSEINRSYNFALDDLYLRHYTFEIEDIYIYLEKKLFFEHKTIIIHLFTNNDYTSFIVTPKQDIRKNRSSNRFDLIDVIGYIVKGIQEKKKEKNDRANNTHLLRNEYEVDGNKIEIYIDKYNYDLFVNVNGQKITQFEEIK